MFAVFLHTPSRSVQVSPGIGAEPLADDWDADSHTTESGPDDDSSLGDSSDTRSSSSTAVSRLMCRVRTACIESFNWFSQHLLQNYSIWYTAYLVALIMCGALTMLLFDAGLGPINALYLAVSSVTETGLSSVDFAARHWTTHVVCWILIILGSPVLLSIVPVTLRLVIMMHSKRGDSDPPDQAGGEHQRRGGGAFFGLMTTAGDECLALEMISCLVFFYWAGVQAIGWLALWAILPLSVSNESSEGQGSNGQVSNGLGPWPALFLSTSAFHNAGLILSKDGLPLTGVAAAWGLGIIMMLILCGNSCFPILLRFLVWCAARCPLLSDNRRHVLRLLLRFPRTCYTHLFPNYGTKWLATVTVLLIAIQIGALCVADLWAEPHGETSSDIMAGLTLTERIIAIIFQSVSTRTAGFSVLNLRLLSPTSAFVFCVCMWISICPVVVVMRSTTRIQGRIVPGYYLDEGQTQQKEKDARDIKHQFSSFMSQNSGAIMGLFFLILVAEEWHTTKQDVRERRFLFMLFECCSAYGTVGLSMSDKPWSRSGNWSITSQVCLMMIMFLGRLRGLPESIDPTFRFGTNVDPTATFGIRSRDEDKDGDEPATSSSTEDHETMF